MKELKKELIKRYGKVEIDWEELQERNKERQKAREGKNIEDYLNSVKNLYCKEFLYCYQNDLIFRKNATYYLWLRTDLGIK